MTTLDKMLQGLANALGASLSTLTTTAKTVVGAINELKSGLTTTTNTVSGHTSIIGSGSLDTTSQTLVGAVNELAARGVTYSRYNGSKTLTALRSTVREQIADVVAPPGSIIYLKFSKTSNSGTVALCGRPASAGSVTLKGWNKLSNSTYWDNRTLTYYDWDASSVSTFFSFETYSTVGEALYFYPASNTQNIEFAVSLYANFSSAYSETMTYDIEVIKLV